jgi:hypothetical protein
MKRINGGRIEIAAPARIRFAESDALPRSMLSVRVKTWFS